MIHENIYFAAVVPARDPEQAPYVSTPLGPFSPDEREAHHRAVAWLKDAYKTDDVRLIDMRGWPLGDFEVARTLLMGEVFEDHEKARLAREAERAEAALSALGPESWGSGVCREDVAADQLDSVLVMLGVDPADV